MERSPVRRSNRLQGNEIPNDEGNSLPAVTQPLPCQIAPNSITTATSTSTVTTAVINSATTSNKKGKPTTDNVKPQSPATVQAANVTEMQKQIAYLKRQLSDTQVKLNNSNRHCQQLESVIESSSSSSSVSIHNLTNSVTQPTTSDFAANAIASTTPTEAINTSSSAMASHTTTTTAAISSIQTVPIFTNSAAMSSLFTAPIYTNSATTSSLCQPTYTSSAAVPSLYTMPPYTSSAAVPSVYTMPPYTSNAAMSSSFPAQVPASSAAMSSTSTAPAVDNYNAYFSTSTNYGMPPFCGPSNLAAINYQDSCMMQNSSSGIMFPRKVQDLPEFSGDPEDWPIFHTAFVQSTAAFNYTNLENNQRLLKCLKGDAREVIKSLLIHPDNVNAVIEQLRFRFGRPEQLIQSQLRQVRELSHISENNLSKLVPFATKVKNLSVFLQSVNGQQHIANPTLLEELVLKLPMSKKLEWARVAANIRPYPTILHFSDWISEMANFICTVQDADYNEPKRRVLIHNTQKPPLCPLCQDQHKLFDCQRFLDSTVNERWSQVKQIYACFSCLNVGHTTRNCHRKKTCSQNGCQRKHHILLHEDTTAVESTITPSTSSESQQSVLNCSSTNNNKLLFRVLPVTLHGEKCRMDIYALFDDGSSITMLDKDVAKQLGVRGKKGELNIQWYGDRSAQETVIAFNVQVSGVGKNKCHLLRNVYAVSNLNLPMQSLSENDLENWFQSSVPIKPYTNVIPQLLIGLDHSFLGLPTNPYVSLSPGPFACNTELGWVVFGPCCTLSTNSPSCLMVNVDNDNSIHELVKNYFNIENVGVRSAPLIECDDDVRANRILQETTQRVGNRFQTGLIWKYDDVKFPNSYPMALRRLIGIEKKMTREEDFALAYKEVIKGYVDKGYVRKLPSNEVNMPSDRKWYLPHFGVINPNKQKKVRLVFDAAAQVDGVSLNSYLLKGPQDIASLPSILYNFRRGRVAVCADIREMFHQVLIQPEDRVSQRFLWRDGNPNKTPDEYEMVVMTFGAACSPCSARYVMKVNAENHNQFQPRAIEAILKHHYIDDFVDSFESEDEAIEISTQVRDIHKKGGFDLRGFISNSDQVSVALGGTTAPKIMLADDGTEKVLGLYWESTSDNFKFNLRFHRVDSAVMSGERRPSKRELLSIIMSTFDPLGFLSFYTVGGKLILREVWRLDCRWDEAIPDDVNNSWEQWRNQMNKIEEFRVPRCYFPMGTPNCLNLHIFVDASEDAFAAVAYWRWIDCNDKINISFVASKTKCAPLKRVTIPRLELQAAVLGTRLMQSILDCHDLTPEKCVLWSDSKTVLKWIASSHRRYKPYVAHRISEILASTEINNWKWVSTYDNVADDATRSSNNVNFSSTSRWLTGPSFLKLHEDEWFANYVDEESNDADEEELRPKFNLLVVSDQFINFNRFSSLFRIKRTTAWVLRFINCCRAKENNCPTYGLTAYELEEAEKLLCLQTQKEIFSAEIQCIKRNETLPKGSNLVQLTPYIDDDGLLRVYGRIDAASFLPYSSRRPIILPYDHVFTNLVVHHYHCQMKHQNHEATICEIRKTYWIPQMRRLLRKVTSHCMICKNKRATPREPIMGPLPIDRLEPYTRPFKYTGLDYFGPITVSIGRRSEKRWVALFTCLTVRAIHLEVAQDLSTDSCIIAMRNFMNRRGVPVRIRSDNGKNFIGANEEAKRFSEVFEADRIQNELSNKGVEWVFNCPINPSEGGIWERMVQCVKKVLRQTLKDVSPKEHVLQSLLIEAENIVNSRPLTYLPISPDEEEPLTPNHFLVGYGNVSQTPAADEPDSKMCSLRKQWRVARSLRDRFWKRWVLEYLPTLTRRVKWCERTSPIKENDVVFICDPNLPRSQWRRGIVVRVYCGGDGVARRADVKTASGVLQRAVSKLAVLDLDNGEADRSTGVGVLQNAL